MATISKTRIANLALGHLRTSASIENIETETSVEAKRARLWYDHAREQALAAANWSFARKRLTASTHSEAAPDEWTYRYQYPSDCLQMRKIDNPAGSDADAIPYEIEYADTDGTRSIVTDQNEAVLIYTRNQEDTTLFSPDFVLALSYLLAFYLAGSLTGKEKLEDKMRQNYQTQVLLASAQNHNEEVDRKPRDAEWTRGDVR